ncbi:MAG: hypothetical protein HUU29_10115, partial [Planctomycetaceae bacterium]|nr:hypothetical protein [Planctomycetaceae bacterium]
MRVRAWVAFCFVVMMVAPAMWAVTITWNGNGDGSDWHDPGNWDLVQVPTSADDVIVADTGGLDPLVSTDAAFAKSITIQDAATLTIAFAGCQVEDDITVEYLGILYMDGTITGDSELLADNLIVEGAYSVGGSSLPYPTLQLASKLTVVSGGFLVANGLNFSSADNAIPYAIEIHDNVDVLLFDYVNIINASSTTAVILLDNVLSDPGIFTEFAISGSSPANIDATNYAGAGITVTPNLLGTGTLYGESLDIDPSGLVDWINLPTSTTWLGTTNTTWSVASNWSDGVPTGGVDAIIQTATNQPTITSAAACKSLIIDPSATLTISGSQELTVRGNWTNNGTFTANSSRVVFTDAASATVGGSSTTTFWNLRISEPGTIENSGVRWKASNDFEVLTGTVTINNVTGNDLEVSGRLLAGGATSFELKSGTAALVNTPTQSAVIGNLLSNGSGSSRPQINGPFKQLTLNGTTDIDGCMIDLSGATMISYGLIVNNTVTQFDNVSVLNAPSSITTAAMRLTGSNFPSTFNDFEISGSAPANIDANLVPASVFVFVDAATGGGGSLFGETLDIDNNEVLAWEGDTTLAQWTGTAGTNWFNSANWSNSSVPTTSNNAIISDVSGGSGNFPVIDSSQGSNANAKKLMIRPSASLTTAGTPILTLHNSLINDGVFLDAAGTVRFEGSTSGSVGGSSAPAFHHVVVNKSGSVSIGNSGVAWDIGGNLSVDGGVFEVNEVAGSPNCQIDGNLTVAASQVFVNMASEQSIIGGSVQNDGDISGGTTTAGTFTNNGDVSNFFSGVTNVASDFTNNGTINGTLTLSGTGTQSVVLNAPVGLVGFVVDGVSPQTVAVTGANSLDTTTFSAATPGNVTFNGDAIDVGIMTIENGCSLTLAANSSLGVLDIIFINGVFVNGTLRTAVGSGTVRPIFSGPGAVISFDNGSTADIDGLVVDGAGTDPYSIEFLNGATIAKFDNVSIINTAAASAGIYLGNVSAPASFGAFEISGTTPKNIDATGFTGSAINITQGPNSGGNRWGASFEIDPGSKLNWVTSGINVREDDEFGDPVVNGAAPTGNRAFGNQPVTAGVTADSTIFVKNIGGTTLSMSIPVWDSGDSSEFILDTSGFLTSLSPGQSTTFTVAFDPNSPGPKLATISFTHNAANETSPFEFDVGGTGTGPIPVTTDITADETWNFFGSPYQLNPTPGQNITVRNGATLTIDSSAGPVVIEWLDDGNCDFDFCIGDGASQPGTLVINAVNPITFKICPSGNVRVRNNGQITFTSSASTTSFIPMETSPNDLWGALIFEAGQTQQSDLQNCAFTRGGFDTREAALVIEDSENFTPILKNLTFTSPNLAGIKVLGKGLNTFREEAISGAITVTGGTYSLIVDNATSTVPIRFPSITGQTNPPALMRGTCSVGQSGGGAAPWAFADAWVFNCAAASKVQIVHGYVSGNESQRPTFKSVDTTPTNSDWVGFEESTTVHNNIFGDLGTVAFLDIRDAAIGVNVSKGSLIPQAGKETLRRFPGITAKHCNIGMRVETTASAANVYGYNTRIEECQFGAPNTADTCAFGVRVVHGRVEIRDSKVLGATAAGVQNGQPASADSYTDLTIRECRITTNAGTHGVRLTGNAADADVLIERTEIEGFNYGVRVEQASTWNVHRTLTVRDCFVNATGLTAIPIDPEIHQFPLPLQGGGSAPSGGTVTPSGGGATSSGGTVSSQTSEALVIAIRGLGDPFYFSFVPGGVTAGLDVVIEDCTVMQGDAGIRGVDLKNNCSVTVKRTIFKNSNNGFRAINSAAANCPYYFEECEFLSHKKEGALDERNVAGAFPTYYRCSFVGNTLYGVKDNAAPSSLASNCYWGAANGPDDDAGVINGSGDKVSLNVTVTPFLDSPFIGTLTGASPASASEFDVQETATVDADNLHVIDQTPFFTWVFGSDFEGDVQSAYHIQVDNNSDFSSTLWNTTKVVSTATSVEYAGGALTDGTVYYARIRLWNQHAVWGPWKELTFRMNTKPVAVGNTNRFPQDTVTISDVSPEYIWTCPTDAQ